jgi:hypothetical protein
MNQKNTHCATVVEAVSATTELSNAGAPHAGGAGGSSLEAEADRLKNVTSTSSDMSNIPLPPPPPPPGFLVPEKSQTVKCFNISRRIQLSNNSICRIFSRRKR